MTTTLRSALLALVSMVGVSLLLTLGARNVTAAPPASAVKVLTVGDPINICGEGQLGDPNKVLFEVPSDKRLEIEYGSISASGTLEEGERLVISIETIAGGNPGRFLVGELLGPPVFDEDARVMKVFADPGTEVTVQQGITGLVGPGTVCLSGRLVPLN